MWLILWSVIVHYCYCSLFVNDGDGCFPLLPGGDESQVGHQQRDRSRPSHSCGVVILDLLETAIPWWCWFILNCLISFQGWLYKYFRKSLLTVFFGRNWNLEWNRGSRPGRCCIGVPTFRQYLWHQLIELNALCASSNTKPQGDKLREETNAGTFSALQEASAWVT